MTEYVVALVGTFVDLVVALWLTRLWAGKWPGEFEGVEGYTLWMVTALALSVVFYVNVVEQRS